MRFFYKLWRVTKVVAHFAYAVVDLTIRRPRTRPERAAWLSQFCRRVLRSLGITYTAEGPVPMAGAVISNHLTYADILVHAAIRPCVFVAKSEVRKLPVMGWISMMSGTVYVERGAGGSARAAAVTMAKGFRDGLPIVFFPEGTTGVGDEPVMPFHTGLLAQALAAEQPITPGFLAYELSGADLARGKTVRNDVAWGPQTMGAHLWNFLGLDPVRATLRFARQPIAFSPEALTDRKRAGVEAREGVLVLSSAQPGEEGN